MNYKDVLEFSAKAEEMGTNIPDNGEYFNSVVEIGEWLNEKSEEGTNIILNRLKEEDFVRFMRAVKAALITSMAMEGKGMTLLIANMEGDLDAFMHTSLLALLGVLAEEEVI